MGLRVNVVVPAAGVFAVGPTNLVPYNFRTRVFWKSFVWMNPLVNSGGWCQQSLGHVNNKELGLDKFSTDEY